MTDFQFFFHCYTQQEICNKDIITDPPQSPGGGLGAKPPETRENANFQLRRGTCMMHPCPLATPLSIVLKELGKEAMACARTIRLRLAALLTYFFVSVAECITSDVLFVCLL